MNASPFTGVLGLAAHPIKGAFMSYDRWKRQGTDPLRPSRLRIGANELAQSTDAQRRTIIEAFQQAVLTTEQRKADLHQRALLEMQQTETDSGAISGAASGAGTPSRSGMNSPLPPPYDGYEGKELAGLDLRDKELPPTPSSKEEVETSYFV